MHKEIQKRFDKIDEYCKNQSESNSTNEINIKNQAMEINKISKRFDTILDTKNYEEYKSNMEIRINKFTEMISENKDYIKKIYIELTNNTKSIQENIKGIDKELNQIKTDIITIRTDLQKNSRKNHKETLTLHCLKKCYCITGTFS